MAIFTDYNLDMEINSLLAAEGSPDREEKFKERLSGHIRSRQKRTAMKILERIYGNDSKALQHDMEPEEKAKILTVINKDTPVEESERRRLFSLLYPMLQKEFGGFL